MAGQKPAYTRQALALLADHLESAYQLAVVVYDDQVQTLLASAPVVAKDPIKALLSGIESGGSTNLSGGLAAGMQQAAPHVAPDRVTRVLLLTDGLANVGVTDPDTLTAWTRTWRERGIALSTLGVGDDFNEDLLVALAEAGGGNFHYIAVLADARPRCPLRLGILVQQSLAGRIAAGVRPLVGHLVQQHLPVALGSGSLARRRKRRARADHRHALGARSASQFLRPPVRQVLLRQRARSEALLLRRHLMVHARLQVQLRHAHPAASGKHLRKIAKRPGATGWRAGRFQSRSARTSPILLWRHRR